MIDQLSRDPGGNKGRIDFLPPSPDPTTATFSPKTSTPPPPPSAIPGQFEDAPSPRKSPPTPISVSRTQNIPAGGFSPKRHHVVRQGYGRKPSGDLLGSGGVTISPSAASFASSHSGGGGSGKPVEDRLQALMDRLVSSGATRKV